MVFICFPRNLYVWPLFVPIIIIALLSGGIISDDWIDTSNSEAYYGFFKICIKQKNSWDEDESVCKYWSDSSQSQPTWMIVAFSLQVLSILFLIVMSIIFILMIPCPGRKSCCCTNRKLGWKIIFGILLVQNICLLTIIILFPLRKNDYKILGYDSYKVGSSYTYICVAFAFTFITTCCVPCCLFIYKKYIDGCYCLNGCQTQACFCRRKGRNCKEACHKNTPCSNRLIMPDQIMEQSLY